MADTVLETWDTWVNKTEPDFMELSLQQKKTGDKQLALKIK